MTLQKSPYSLKSCVVFLMFLAASVVSFGEMQAASAADRAKITIPVTAEGWVVTKTARVIVGFDVVPDIKAQHKTQERIQAALKQLAKDADWNTTAFHQNQDRSGLTHWRVSAETRIDGATLANLPTEASRISEPGFHVSIASIQFTPSQAERTAAENKVRAEIYTIAETEVQSLTESFNDSQWRVLSVNFTNRTVRPMQKANLMHAEMMRADSPGQASGGNMRPAAMPIAERLSLDAIVTLERRE